MPRSRPKLLWFALLFVTAVALSFWLWQRLDRTQLQSAQTAPTPIAQTPIQMEAPPPVPDHLRFLANASQPWQERLQSLAEALNSSCGESELSYLYWLLEHGSPVNEAAEAWYVVANGIMEVLAERDANEERFSSRFVLFLQDESQPVVLRDYAVQHLAFWINPMGQPGSPVRQQRPADLTQSVLQAFAQAVSEPTLQTTSIPATVCMVLVSLNHAHSGVDCTETLSKLQPWLAAALGEDSSLTTASRVSAVHAAALSPETFRVAIRKLAYQSNGVSPLRLSAVAALAKCGEASDLPSLQALNDSVPELATAANQAQRSLAIRLNPTPEPPQNSEIK